MPNSISFDSHSHYVTRSPCVDQGWTHGYLPQVPPLANYTHLHRNERLRTVEAVSHAVYKYYQEQVAQAQTLYLSTCIGFSEIS